MAVDRQNHLAFATLTSLFFIWGFVTALNDVLIPHLKAAFDLNYTQAMLVQFCFFGAYFIVSPLAGRLIEHIGYRKGIVAGLLTLGTGCALFYPASIISVYAVFLLALFVLASGVAILQVAANPYVAALGSEQTAASRLNLAQAINSLGHTAGPLFGAVLIFGQATGPESVQLPYLILAAAMVVTAISFKFIKLPKIKYQQEDTAKSDNGSIFTHKRLVLGALAIFLYVGAEVSIASFLVNYFAEPHIGALDALTASKLVSLYWGAAMVGRFVGAWLMRFISPSLILAFNAGAAIVLLLITMNSTGNIAIYSVLAIGFFNSIMFPTIFALAITGLGDKTSRGSGLLCQAIVGGAILPLLQGVLADVTSIQNSFIIPALAYIYIAFYAYSSKCRTAVVTTQEVKV